VHVAISLVGIGTGLMVLAGMLVRVVQLFLKVPALKALAPTQTEPPFVVTQLVVLLTFVVLGVFAVRRFKPATNDLPTFTRSTTAVRA
jgi:hypothetical protein